MDLAVRLGVALSGLAVLVVTISAVRALLAASEWWLVILIYAGLYALAALAVIWLGVFVLYVIVKGLRLIGNATL